MRYSKIPQLMLAVALLLMLTTSVVAFDKGLGTFDQFIAPPPEKKEISPQPPQPNAQKPEQTPQPHTQQPSSQTHKADTLIRKSNIEFEFKECVLRYFETTETNTSLNCTVAITSKRDGKWLFRLYPQGTTLVDSDGNRWRLNSSTLSSQYHKEFPLNIPIFVTLQFTYPKKLNPSSVDVSVAIARYASNWTNSTADISEQLEAKFRNITPQ